MTKKVKKTEDKEKIIYTQNFAGVIKRGPDGNKLIVKSQRWYQHQLNKFRDGEKVSLMLHNEKPKRSDAQNRYLWGVYYPIISKETGERNLDRLHSLFKGMFLTEAVVEVLGKKVRMTKSTTNLSRTAFSEFINSIETETGIEAPPVEESRDSAPLIKSNE